MSDIFISYASENREQAHKLASALETLGWSVWWDRHIITGQAYDQVIEREINDAKSVVVLKRRTRMTLMLSHFEA